MTLKRKLYKKLYEEKDSKEISIIIGPRQVGKTTILKQLKERLASEGKKTVYFDMDILSNYERLQSYEEFLNTITLMGYTNQERFFIFIDEFQRYSSLSTVLKTIYDHHSNIKIYATGSSSITIKKQIQESLSGRKILHYLLPLDFEEYLEFRQDKEALDQYRRISIIAGKITENLLTKHLNTFLIYGGYPSVVLAETEQEKKQKLQSIFDVYVKKDLVEYLNVEKIVGVKKLIEYLSINNAQKINISNITAICDMKRETVEQYLEILEETFIIKRIRPFFTNKTRELTKNPKVYFIDMGVRNFYFRNFNPINLRDEKGFLFENYILVELLKQGKELKYWQNKNKQEVDIIIDNVNAQIPVEVKYVERIKKTDFIGLNAFMRLYPKTRFGVLINTKLQTKSDMIFLINPYNIDKLLS